MGDLTRSRARRWLISASLILLMVGFLVGWVMLGIVSSSRREILSLETLEIVGWFDFIIEALISVAVLLLGQAVVTYEVFTGKTLPSGDPGYRLQSCPRLEPYRPASPDL